VNYTDPSEIEKRSLEIIGNELTGLREKRAETGSPSRVRDPVEEAIIKWVIHTTADFDFDQNLVFTNNAAETALDLLRSGTLIITDTLMAMTGINKKTLTRYHGEVQCFMSDDDVAQAAVDKAASLDRPLIFAAGNAPTALLRLHELIQAGRIMPRLVIAVPVGFVNVEESKELFMDSPIPAIIARGRKGGSPVAAAIINALLAFAGSK
jgi:precorrin-8X/cobalt-precorrin-8 methylmutase